MSTPKPARAAPRWPVHLAACALLALLFALATWLDTRLFLALLSPAPELLESRDWYRTLRILGSMFIWLGVAAILVLIDSGRTVGPSVLGPRATWTRGPFLLVSAGLAGLLAEALKLLFRRGRPIDHDGTYALAPWSLSLETSDFGLPSSHAAVAFAAAFALSHLHPRAGVVFILGAIGCGLTRVLVGQHFVSDVVAGAAVGYAVPAAITWLHQRASLSRPT